MIRVAVTMHGNLRRFLPEGAGSIELELPEGTRIDEVIERLEGRHDVWVAAIGDVAVPLSTPLTDGVAVDFFPHLDGG